MKTNGFFISHLVSLVLSTCLVSSAFANRPYVVVPGHADGSLKLGMSRAEILRECTQTKHTYRFFWNVLIHGKTNRVAVVEDSWDKTEGNINPMSGMDILYINGKVAQVQDEAALAYLPNGVSPGDKLKNVIKEYKSLTLSSYRYAYRDENGLPMGDDEGYYYDDESQGVAFYFGTQDPSAEQKITSIIIHRAGYPVIPPQLGAKVTPIKPYRQLTPAFLYSHLRIR